jgi:hypothetical protein
MLVTSRSYVEYEAMFDLTELPGTELPDSVLDCCAGGSEFVAEAAARGADAVAVDPAYGLPPGELAEVVRRSLPVTAGIIEDHADRFVWHWYGSPGRKHRLRADAAERFVADLAAAPGRYVEGSLPDLPFADRRFSLVLCSHLLFTWAGHYDRDWHLAALRELVRVSRSEVRVFPLVAQGAGDPVPYLPELLDQLAADGIRHEFRKVPYEFQLGADSMLVLTR